MVIRVCEVCGRPHPERHHIVFRSQGGLDFELNYKDLCAEHHKGNYSPHGNRYVDLTYKRQLQERLFSIFTESYYSIDEISKMLGCKMKDLERRFKTAQPDPKTLCHYPSETVVRVLMGGRLY